MAGKKGTSIPRLFLDPSSPHSPESPNAMHQPPFPVFVAPTSSSSSSPIGTDQNPSSSSSSSSSRFHPYFSPIVDHLRTRLFPLVSATTGLPHPEFPTSLLAFHVLTSAQLDGLARHYHQVWPPVPTTSCYPNPVTAWVGTAHELHVDLETKRRRFGRFIGLRDCESPVDGMMDLDGCEQQGSSSSSSLLQSQETETEEQMLARMDREWLECLARASEEDPDILLRWKAGGR
ncbi:hypothetical protein ASPZODRAFT_142864 [Penicilliopsis zonata CBS 506.65]|uniref:Uncharacterized protein n=1 Tax=Penicilliopsis zonata CBS 506.65 TaxID=1073090 RepID=A0A1L9SG45_9EURO|nr:hypothetical protein ASPZODRAFT_142864 [Penicilliopsis zonata CBS 506.65]OJJ46245.1 hypothetical protein ASPZODRAFT_142864 [Penicilliopsis zonata CBS 506.65]